MEIVLQGKSERQRLIKPTLQDILLVENLSVRKVKKNDSIDFRKSVISKPWGAEYLCGRNKNVEVWELYINPNSSTSLHCHPDKDTLNIVLEGQIVLEITGKKEILHAGDFKLIKSGVIHRTINTSIKLRVRILEIESPPNKYNLIRLQDAYGRESMGYIKFRLQKPAKERIKIYSCLCTESSRKSNRFCAIRNFIPSTSKKKRSISIKELLIHSISFKEEKRRLLRSLRSISLKNLFLMEGSLSLHDDDLLVKLLPGNCVFDIPLWEFNWSAKKAKMLIW